MKILKTWLNAWIASNRIKGANSVYPCLFGCDACVDRLSHYSICLKMLTICKFLDRDCPHHPINTLSIDNPDKGVPIHMRCAYSGYHAVISHVKMNHDTCATDCQRSKLSIRSTQKTWSVFADAFAASAHEFGFCTPKFSLVAIINWHLNREGTKCSYFFDGSVHVQEGQNQEAEPTYSFS